MKIIKYKFLSCEVNHGTEEKPDIEQIFLEKHMECKNKEQYEANFLIAEKEAVPGTLDPDNEGEFDEEAQPTDAERIAELEEALDMLLNGFQFFSILFIGVSVCFQRIHSFGMRFDNLVNLFFFDAHCLEHLSGKAHNNLLFFVGVASPFDCMYMRLFIHEYYTKYFAFVNAPRFRRFSCCLPSAVCIRLCVPWRLFGAYERPCDPVRPIQLNERGVFSVGADVSGFVISSVGN